MRIAVLGIGGVGGYIGAKLCTLQALETKKQEIVFIARGAHAQAVKDSGICVVEDDSEFTAKPLKVCPPDAVEGTFDLILCCVKSYDIKDAIMSMRSAIRPDTVIMPLANGVDNARILEACVDAKIINAAVYILAHIESPGVIRKKGKVFALVFGSRRYIGESLFLEHLFQDAGLRIRREDAIETALWKKYLFISAFATLTSYFDTRIKAVYEEHYSITKTLLDEIAAVAAAQGIDVNDEVSKALDTASKLPADASTSMHLDFQNHRRTELESLSGYVVREGMRLGVATPVMSKMYDALLHRCI